MLAEPLGPYLGATLAVEEELVQLVDVQVAVLTQRGGDRRIPSGERRHQLDDVGGSGEDVRFRIESSEESRTSRFRGQS